MIRRMKSAPMTHSDQKYRLLLNRVFQYVAVITVLAIVGGGYWYWKEAQAGVARQAASKDGLVGYWSFDEGAGTQAGDASGNGNTGTLTNGPTWVDGKLGKAINFDGANDIINAGSASNLDDIGARTLSAWIYPESMGENSKGRIFDKAATTSPTLGWVFNIANNEGSYQIGFVYDGSTDLSRRSVPNSIVPNVWQHVLLTWDGSTTASNVHIYVNGTEVNYQVTTNGASLSSDAAQSLRIGNSADGTRTFDGYIDEPLIYDRVLGLTEIADLYALGAAKLNASQNSSLTNGLVGEWSFNGADVSGTTAYDRSGQGNNGTLTNGPTATIGKLGQALSLDGTNDHVVIGDIRDQDYITLSAWIKTSATGAIDQILSRDINSASNRVWQFRKEASEQLKLIVFRESDHTNASAVGTISISDGEWHHVVGTWDGTTIRVFVDGIEDGTGTSFSGTLEQGATNNTYIGRSENADPGYFTGSIDEPRIYNRALSSAEIWDLYHLSNPDQVNSADSQGDSLEKGMVGYWKLDDASGTSATDSSGSANTGTLTNGPTWTTGQIGGAVDFDGTDDYVSAAGSQSVKTLSYWVKPSGQTNGAMELNDSVSVFDNAIPNGITSPTIYVDGTAKTTSYGGDIVVNGNFGSNKTGWTNDAASIPLSWQNAASGDGSTGYLRAGISSNAYYDRFRHDTNIISASTAYRISFWYRTSGITGNMRTGFTSNFATLANSLYGPSITPSTSWRYVSFIMTSTSASYPVFFFHKIGNIGAGSFDVDAISITPVTTHYLITDTNWHHVAITTDTAITASAVKFGRGGLSYLTGSIDEVRFYDQTLSASEVAKLYKTTAPTDPDIDLVGYWSFNGPDISGTTAYDRSGQGNNGTLTNGPVATIGKVGQGMGFDGTNDYVSITNESPFRFTSDFSVSTWIKVPSSLSSYKAVVGKYNATPSGWDLGVGANGLARMTIRGSSSIDTGGAGPDLRDNNWHHVVTVNTPTSITTYVDGSAYGPTTGTWTATTNTLPLIIGNRDTNGTIMFPGSIDEARIYNRVLSASEVTALYSAGR